MSIDTLWFTRCPAPTAASVAIRNGWLAEEFRGDGIDVRSLASSNDRNVHLSHYNHTQANSFRFGGYVPPFVAASRGSDLKVLGVAWPDRAAALYALPESGVRGPQDLRGRRFSLPRRLNDDTDWWRALVLAGYRHALDLAGLSFDDVELVEIEIRRAYADDATTGDGAGQSLWGARSQFAVQREEVRALMAGEVDVLYSDAAMGAILDAFLGLTTVMDLAAPEREGDTRHGHPLVLTASGALVDERPDIVARWLARLLDADAWARKNVDEMRRIIAVDTGLPEDFVEAAYSDRIYSQLDVSLDPGRVALLRAKYDHLVDGGFIPPAVDFDALIASGPLDAARALRG
ncbi:ABC transporter substrate-binding protein [Phenylobacterium sp. SCN 70-31]|uniref:ABC transporter substrate-binding protein n=1 Tax=Phenylobacterium sp. SCN 70-31 TaxID=1660129 RepID=UPI00086842FE|nr:ABC transporter substrate-binding protein [Phenylobacterium sp. SCN 70-31]ODT88621.1 MAG: hypothetical protein ABS78_05510 [Phenylobacterium sp. SCN 70-31]